jgi:putative oxidoreductase
MLATPSTRAAMARRSSLPLRIIVGAAFMVHGYLKLSRGVDFFAAALAGLGIPAALAMAWITTIVEADGLQFGKPGVECDLLYLACIAALWMLPPDPWSWDSRRRAAVISGSSRRG